jgi:hypothetical protein
MYRAIHFWRGQPLHFSALVFILFVTWWGWDRIARPSPVAFWVAVSFPVLHQVFVWGAWRAELRWRGTSRAMGFHGYLLVFFVLFLGRFVSLVLLAWLDRGSLTIQLEIQLAVSILLGSVGLYALYSVQRYFGMRRAAGADHFEEQYRTMPLVRKGIFRFSSNAMYVYAFLLFWVLGVALASEAALVVAAFSHTYIWVHYYCTEKPDMMVMYDSE